MSQSQLRPRFPRTPFEVFFRLSQAASPSPMQTTNPTHHRAGNHAFSLIELLTVIAIIGILAAILIPVVGRVRANARNSTCLSNLRQIGVGCLMYANDHRGLLPVHGPSALTPANEKGANWQEKITPYMSLDRDTVRSRFSCPEARDANSVNETSYNVSWFLDKAPLSGRLQNIITNVVMVADAPVGNYDGIWAWNYSGYSQAQRLQMFRHAGNTRQNAVFTDGSARSLSGTEGGAFRGTGAIPNAWAMLGTGYVNNGYNTNPSSAQDFVP